MSHDPGREAQDIEDMDEVVLKALEMLLGAGGHKAGFKGLGRSLIATREGNSVQDYATALMGTSRKLMNAAKVGLGVTADHWHFGYKDVAMQSFQRGLQRILDDYYVATQLLVDDSDIPPDLIAKLNDRTNRNHILKILGFKRAERDELNQALAQGGDPIDVIKQKMNELNINKEDASLRVSFLISGAMGYLPFSEPYDGQHIHLPLKDPSGNYHRQRMELEKINMSPGIGGPYFALHLQPVDRTVYAQDQVIFMGTNPIPTASGPTVTIHADSIPNMSVGENFVEASRDQFERLFKARYKSNLKDLINNHLDEFTKPDGAIDYQKLWLAARVKNVGHSLGGSIPLQMLVKFPFMVEISAFEPPFLLEKQRREMDRNLEKANGQFKALVDEIATELDPSFDVTKLKSTFPTKKDNLTAILKDNNVIITQLLDLVTKYGTFAPPSQIYHIDTNRQLPKFSKVKDKVYKAVMAGSIMSHAMALAAQTDKVIIKLDREISEKPRRRFTSVLHKMVWKMVNPPFVAYFYLKQFFLKNVYDPKMNPSKNPYYKDVHKEKLEQELKGKWKTIKRAIEQADDPTSWTSGEHLHRKIEDLGRQIQRARNLDLDTSYIQAELETLHADPSEKQKLYLDNIDLVLGNSISGQSAHQVRLLERIQGEFFTYVDTLGSLSAVSQIEPLSAELKLARQNILELYPMLDDNSRKAFLATLQQTIQSGAYRVTTPHSGLLNDLIYRAHSYSEKKSLKNMIHSQVGSLKSAQRHLSNRMGFNLTDNIQKLSSDVLLKRKADCEQYHGSMQDKFYGRLLIGLARDINQELKRRSISEQTARQSYAPQTAVTRARAQVDAENLPDIGNHRRNRP